MSQSTATVRRVLPVVGLSLLVVLAGCGSIGVENPFGGSGDGSAAFADVTTNQSAALDRVGSFTLDIETTTSNGSRSLTESQTIRADREAGLSASRIRREISGANETTLTTDSFTTGERTYLRHVVPGGAAYSYEVRRSSGLVNGSAPSNLAVQFAFDHQRTESGDHLFTVDSADQIKSEGVDQVEDVSVRVRVDGENGLITDLTYHLALAGSGGTTTYHTERELTDVGSTSVSPPYWIETAANRTDTKAPDLKESSNDDSSQDANDAPADQDSIQAIADPAALRGDITVRRPLNFSVFRATNGNFENLDGGPYVRDGTVYAFYTGLKKSGQDGSFYTTLFAHDPATMEPTWRYEFPADRSRVGKPVFDNGTVYQITLENRGRDDKNPYVLTAIDASEGTKLWERGLGKLDLRDEEFLAPGSATIHTHDGLVYVLNVTTGPQTLLALDAETGATAWSFDGPEYGEAGGVAIHEDRVFVGAKNDGRNAAVALDAASGSVRWTHAFADQSATFSVDHADSKGVYIAERTGSASTDLLSLRPDSGATRWQFDVEANFARFLRSYPDADMVVVQRRNQQLLGLDRDDGTTLLSASGNGPTRWNSQAGETNLYYGTNTKIEAVRPAAFVDDPEAGSWDVQGDEGTFGSGEIHQVQEVNGVVYATDADGDMAAYAASDGTLLYEEWLEYARIDRVDAYEGAVYVGDRSTNVIYVLAPVDTGSVTETSSRATPESSRDATPTSSAAGPGFGVGVALVSLLLGLGLLVGRRGRSQR